MRLPRDWKIGGLLCSARCLVKLTGHLTCSSNEITQRGRDAGDQGRSSRAGRTASARPCSPRGRGVYAAVMPQTVPGLDRLTVEADKLGGQACIRGYRFSAEHLLKLLAAGWTLELVQADFLFIEPDDVQQVLSYAAALAHQEIYVPLQEPA